MIRVFLVMFVGPMLGLFFLAGSAYSFFHQTEQIGVMQSITFGSIGLYLLYAAIREYPRKNGVKTKRG